MLQSHTPSSSEFIAALNLLANDDTATPVCMARETSHANPMLEPSVAESAGLNRFVYIVGHSEIRYVFSSIQKNQASTARRIGIVPPLDAGVITLTN